MPEQSVRQLTVIEDPDNPGELILDLTTELCEELGWKVGDTLEWTKQEDNSWTLRKKATSNSS